MLLFTMCIGVLAFLGSLDSLESPKMAAFNLTGEWNVPAFVAGTLGICAGPMAFAVAVASFARTPFSPRTRAMGDRPGHDLRVHGS